MSWAVSSATPALQGIFLGKDCKASGLQCQPVYPSLIAYGRWARHPAPLHCADGGACVIVYHQLSRRSFLMRTPIAALLSPDCSRCRVPGRAARSARGRSDETLLTVSASGRSEARPDEARLQLGVQSVAASAGEDGTRQSRQNGAGDGGADSARGASGRPADAQPYALAHRLRARPGPVPRRQCRRGQAARHEPGRRGRRGGDRLRRQPAGRPTCASPTAKPRPARPMPAPIALRARPRRGLWGAPRACGSSGCSPSMTAANMGVPPPYARPVSADMAERVRRRRRGKRRRSAPASTRRRYGPGRLRLGE